MPVTYCLCDLSTIHARTESPNLRSPASSSVADQADLVRYGFAYEMVHSSRFSCAIARATNCLCVDRSHDDVFAPGRPPLPPASSRFSQCRCFEPSRRRKFRRPQRYPRAFRYPGRPIRRGCGTYNAQCYNYRSPCPLNLQGGHALFAGQHQVDDPNQSLSGLLVFSKIVPTKTEKR